MSGLHCAYAGHGQAREFRPLTRARQNNRPAWRHVICFGNPLHGDDGFGPAVYERLACLPRPKDLRLTDAGTPGPAALALFQDCGEVVIVDTLSPAGAPGRLRWLPPSAVMAEQSLAGHGSGAGYILRALAALPEHVPHIKILAAEASAVTPFCPGLSAPAAKAVNDAVALLSKYFEAGSDE